MKALRTDPDHRRWLLSTHPSVPGLPPLLCLALAVFSFSGALGGGLTAAGASSDHRLEPQAIRAATEADAGTSQRKIRRELNRLTRAAKRALAGAGSAREKRERLNRLFFVDAGFKPASDQASAEGLLLHHVLRSREGTCVGLALVYIILAERLGLPVVAAATPTHLVARWVEGEISINTELLESGAEHPDSEYRSRHRIREPDPAHPVFLRNLGSLEVMARVHNNLGVIRSRAGSLEAAAGHYARALELDPLFPAPHYNRGLDRLNTGDPAEALADFEAALAIYPADTWALNNRGLALLQLGRIQDAIADFERALTFDPELAPAKKNLGIARSRTSASRTEAVSPVGAPVEPSSSGEPAAARP